MSVNTSSQSRDIMKAHPATVARFDAFKTDVDVIFWDDECPKLKTQRLLLTEFKKRQTLLATGILKKVFPIYLKDGAGFLTTHVVDNLHPDLLTLYAPTIQHPQQLTACVQPLVIYFDGAAAEGNLGIIFECCWKPFHALGVAIRKWRVVEAGDETRAYF